MEAAAQKTQFLKEFGDDYGYSNGSKGIDEIRATEFKRLDQSDTVYLDHAGPTLYSELQMESIFKDLTSNIYGNPHSQSDTSSTTTEILRGARQQVLDYFNASPKDYTCVFTSGATAALKLVGEAFPWSRGGCFMHTMENHNSVLGLREYALNQGAAAFAIDVEEYVHDYGACNGNVTPVKIIQHPVQRREQANHLEGEPTGDSYSLFAFPSECNFSGFRFNLQLVKLIKQDARKVLEDSPFSKGPWMVLIDAAKGCATHPPDLSEYPADFVALSFYKLFGYPTGLGALLVRKDAAKLLKKTYFSGGTVSASFADMDFVKRRESLEELFEDGTSSFLSIASLRHGFKILNSLTTPMICRHTASLTAYVKKILLSLRHEDGSRVCVLYGLHGSEVIDYKSGPTVTFNLKRSDGSWVGYREVEKLASLSGIQLRTGCFCNPGACAKYLGLSHQDLLLNLEAGHTCWDDNDVIHGKPTGAVRVSFGYMSTYEDAKKFIDVITSSFVSSPSKSGSKILLRTRSISPSPEGQERRLVSTGYILKSITIYPIKSCAGFSVDSWPLSSAGLLHDREWLLKSLAGEILTQKKVPEMCFISTHIDLKRGIMFVESPRCREKLQVNLKMDLHPGEGKGTELDTKRYEERHYDNDINLWFSNAVGRPCTLLRHPSSKYFLSNHEGSAGLCRNVGNKLNFANDAQFLLVSEESVSELNCRLSLNQQKRTHGAVVQVDPMRFRPNFVISGGEPFVEDGWRSITIGNINFVSLGGCNRCQMINSVQQAGQVQRSNEPLATLASYRRVKGKILFGILLRLEFGDDEFDTDSWLRVAQEVHPS